MQKTEIAVLSIVGIMVVLDYLTGLLKAFKQHDVSSEKMREGLWHKGAYVIVMTMAEIIEHAQSIVDLGISVPLIVPAGVYIALTEISSTLENLAVINPELANGPIMSLFRSTKTNHKGA